MINKDLSREIILKTQNFIQDLSESGVTLHLIDGKHILLLQDEEGNIIENTEICKDSKQIAILKIGELMLPLNQLLEIIALQGQKGE